MQKGENYHAVQRDRLRGWRGVFDGNAFLLESSLPAAVRKGFCCCQVVLPTAAPPGNNMNRRAAKGGEEA